MIETEVLIVGGGPVGLTLALELGSRGIDCVLVEERTAPTEHPKATLLGARSMEHFRRLGIADRVLNAALPPEINYFITFSTRLAGHELHRITSPSIAETITRPPDVVRRYRELGWSPYYKTQIGQQALEPVIWAAAAEKSSVRLLHGTRFLSHAETAEGVTAELSHLASGAAETVRAAYMVACDGGASAVRKALGIRMNGRGRMRPNVSFYFRSDEFLRVHDRGVGNLYFIMAPGSFGLFTAIDGVRDWSFQFYFLDPAARTTDLDPTEVLHRAVGRPFAFELTAVQHWWHHQSVARRWRSRRGDPLLGDPGRVFLAGDAAHLFPPTGGVGMNTGIGDAVDIGWKLWAVLRGFGGPGLLEAYERERKPVAVRNSVISANNSDKIDMVMDETPPEVEDDGPAGEAARAEVRHKIRWMSKQFASAGTHLGYRYADSPIVVPDGTPEPPDDPSQVSPSTWPGSRAPHAFLGSDTRATGRSTLDLIGPGFSLVSFGAETGAIERVFANRNAPLSVHPLDDPALAALYERRLVLLRPDGHVAWRGDAPPPDPEGLFDVVLGHR